MGISNFKFRISKKRRGASALPFLIIGGILVVIFAITIPLILVFSLPFGQEAKATGAGGTTAQAFATAYCPVNNSLEGGKVDKQGKPVHTIQQFVAGQADYVSVAMDKALPYAYGTPISIPELDQKYNN